MFQAVPPPIIRSKTCTYSFRYCQPILLLAGSVDEMEISQNNHVEFTRAVIQADISQIHFLVFCASQTIIWKINSAILNIYSYRLMRWNERDISSTIAVSSSIG